MQCSTLLQRHAPVKHILRSSASQTCVHPRNISTRRTVGLGFNSARATKAESRGEKDTDPSQSDRIPPAQTNIAASDHSPSWTSRRLQHTAIPPRTWQQRNGERRLLQPGIKRSANSRETNSPRPHPLHTARVPSDVDAQDGVQSLQKGDEQIPEEQGHNMQLALMLLEHAITEIISIPGTMTDLDIELEEVVNTVTEEPSTTRPFERPSVWSKSTFSAYVKDLTVAKDPGANLSTHTSGWPIVHAISEELVSLFNDKRFEDWIEHDDLNHCLNFLERHHQLASLAIIRHKTNNHRRTHYHICLRKAAKDNSVKDFLTSLEEMLKKDVRATEDTWMIAYLLASRTSPLLAPRILSAMREKGVPINQAVVERVALKSLSSDALKAFGKGMDLEAFLCSLDLRYGLDRSWLAEPAVEKLLEVLLAHGRQEDVMSLISRGAHVKAGSRMADTLMESAVQRQDMDAAVMYLTAITSKRPDVSKPGSWTTRDRADSKPGDLVWKSHTYMYTPLFRIAWGGIHLNCLRVIWRYACMAGFVPSRMRRYMYRKGIPLDLHDETSNIWKQKLAARFALGLGMMVEDKHLSSAPFNEHPIESASTTYETRTNLATGSSSHQNPPTSTDYAPPTLRLISPSPVSECEVDTGHIAAVSQDIQTGSAFRPTRDMLELLQEAWDLDRQWAASTDEMNFDRKLELGISVPVVRR